MVSLPDVSVIVPVYNEEKYISECLLSVIRGDYPKELLEIIVVDGMSSDATVDIVNRLAADWPFVRCLANPSRTVPQAMNIGIRSSRGDVIVRIDAHAQYVSNYVSSLVSALIELNADNVGGSIVTLPANASSEAIAVATVLSHPLGVGNSTFRVSNVAKPTLVDTVPFGCFQRTIFDRIGFFDEMLLRNQDDELNARIILNGGKIYLIPGVVTEYVARDSIPKMCRMLFQYGYFKPLTLIKLGRPATIRQFVPPVFVLCVFFLPVLMLLSTAFAILWLSIVVLYIMAVSFATFRLSLRIGFNKFFYLFSGFVGAHFSYGIGYLKGVVDFFIRRVHLKSKIGVPSNSR